MSLETVLIILFVSPFVIGVLSVFTTGRHQVTPIVIDYKPSAQTQGEFLDDKNVASETEVLPVAIGQDQETPRLEDSPEALETLREIENEEDGENPTHYEVSAIPEELNRSIDDLFKELSGREELTPPEVIALSSEHEVCLTPELNRESTANDSEEPVFLPAPAGLDVEMNYEQFEAGCESIDEMLEHLEQEGAFIHSGPLPIDEYRALRRLYGDEIVNRITTTPGKGGSGDYDCMIGRVMQKYNQTILQYRDHFIPLKGLEGQEGIFLVEGMFVKPDLFYVRSYTELSESTTSFDRAAEN